MADKIHDEDDVRLGLGLCLGSSNYNPKKRENESSQNKNRKISLGLSIPLHVDSSSSLKIMRSKGETKKLGVDKNGLSNIGDDEDEEDDSNYECKFPEDLRCRKKLRLSRDQTTLLENSFKQQTTLNTAVKQALAEKLNLKPRQVEVWFQNRRARTKLKQTEVDCEFLKKNCERLSEENWRLKKELLELRSTMKTEKPPPPPQFLYHAAREKNRGGGEKKEAPATEVVHISPN